MPPRPRPARFRALFSLDPATGGLVWQPRPASDFLALGMSKRGAARAALDWIAHKAGRAPQWRESPDGLACRVDRAPATLADICHALGADVAQAESAARAAMDSQQHHAARGLVLRLCALDSAGRIVWTARNAQTSPKTRPEARDQFNARWAGVPLPVRHGEITIQRQRIDHAQALHWLTSAKASSRNQGDATLLDLWQPVAQTAEIPAPGLHPEYVLHCAIYGLDPAQTADHLRRVCIQCAEIPSNTLAALVAATLEDN